MKNYIYEMHLTMLRINYLCAENQFCDNIKTVMINMKPYDMTDLLMTYQTHLYENRLDTNLNCILPECIDSIEAESLEQLVEKARIVIRERKLKNVNKSVHKLVSDRSTPGES